jgi:hypothetical protein
VKLTYCNCQPGNPQAQVERTGRENRNIRQRDLRSIQHTRSSSRDMNTTLSTLFLVAGSTGAAILEILFADVVFWGNSRAWVSSPPVMQCVESPRRNNGQAGKHKEALMAVGTVRPECSLLAGRVVLMLCCPPSKRLG